ASNMSQTSGTSIMMTRSAGQQVAGDLSRGMVQGVSGYFSRKVRHPKVPVKAGHQIFLVPKNKCPTKIKKKMKAIFKSLMAMVCLTVFIAGANAQQVASSLAKLSMGKVEPYEMQVTYSKTSHLIFPSTIRYVDLGSEYLIAGKAEDAE